MHRAQGKKKTIKQEGTIHCAQNHKNCRGVLHTPKENQQSQYGLNKFDHYTKNYTLFEKFLNFELWFYVFRF